MTDIKKGDRVKVTSIGEVIFLGKRSIEVRTDGGAVVEVYTPSSPLGDIASVEKVEPPVEAFKPGDVVRSVRKVPVGNVYALTNDGFVRLVGTGWAHSENGVHVPFPIEEFTSEHYEKVNIS